MPYKRFLFLVFWLTATVGFAQKIEQRISFKHLTIRDGLVSNQTNDCYQDSKGFIWIGSNGGASRYDGDSFMNLTADENDSTKLPSPLVKCITEDKHGNLWFGTVDRGLTRYNTQTEQFTRFSTESKHNPLKSNAVLNLLTDHNGDVWFCMENWGYGKITIPDDASQACTITNYEGFTKGQKGIDYIFEDSQHRMWLCDRSGVYYFENDGSTPEIIPVYKERGGVYITEDREKRLYFSDRWGLLWEVDTSAKKLSYYQIQFDEAYRQLQRADEFRFAFTTDNEMIGVRAFNGMFRATIDHEKRMLHLIKAYVKDPLDLESPQANSNRDVIVDKTGVVWIATQDAGVSFFDPHRKQFGLVRDNPKPGSLKGGNILYMYEDRYQNLWLSVKGEDVHCLIADSTGNRGYENFQYYNDSRGIKNPMFTTIYETFSGERSALWFSSWVTFRSIEYEPWRRGNIYFNSYIHGQGNAFKNGMYWAMLQDSKGKVWYGLYAGGLMSFDLDADLQIKNERYYMHDTDDENSLSNNTIRSIYETRDGTLWIGTAEGLNRVIFKNDSVQFKNYLNDTEDPNSIGHNYIQRIYESASGTMWLCSLGGGLIKVYRDKNGEIERFQSYTTEHGLPNNTIKGILEDDHGNLWISSSGGLSKFNPQTGKIKNYTEEDGLQGNDFRDNSCLKRKNGQMLFGGFNGFNVFYPDSIKENKHYPDVELTDFKVYGKSVKAREQINGHQVLSKSIVEADTIVVTYRENVIEFNFAALHFASPSLNRLKYRLVGFDKDWVYPPHNRRFASYTNLDGGTYTFEVMGSNNDGLWNPKARKVILKVLPPWWKTTWFKVLFAVSVVLLFAAFYIYRMRAVKAENERLEKLVNIRTENLQKANTELKEKQEEILSQKDEIAQQAEELKTINDEITTKNETLEEQKRTIEVSYENIKRLGEFGQEVTSVLNIQDISNVVNGYIAHFMDADAYGVGIVARKKRTVVFENFVLDEKQQNTLSCDMNDKNSLVHLCLTKKRIVRSGRVSEEFPEYVSCFGDEAYCKQIRSVIYLPLFEGEKAIGVLVVHSREYDAFDSQQQNILQNLASYISVAMVNARSYRVIEQKNEDIGNSIRYAQTIQEAILPLKERIREYFDYFSIFKPKDLVSGDFYWFTGIERENQSDLLLFAVIDCTGHGVPGAIMSIVSNGALNRIVKERNVTAPAEILENLDLEIRTILKQDKTDNKDGMDVCLCSFSDNGDGTSEVLFSAAKRPLYLYRNKKQTLETYKGTRRYIGGVRSKNVSPFETERLTISQNDVLYLSSDGFVDQNSPARERYGSKRFLSLLNNIGSKPIAEQQDVLNTEFYAHMQDEEQRDDVTLVGLKMKGE